MSRYAVTASRTDCYKAVDRAWLVELHWGREYTLSTHFVVITGPDGNDIPYNGGIISDPSPVLTSNREGVEDAGQSIGLALALDDTDIAARIAAGHRLQEATASVWEVYLDKRGNVIQSYDNRIAWVVNGRCVQPSFDRPEESTGYLRITVESQPADDTTTYLEPGAFIDEETWSGVDSDSEQAGKVYPRPFGRAGEFWKASGSPGVTSGSPAYVVGYSLSGNNETLLVADEQSHAPQVRIFDSSGNNALVTVGHRLDGRGRYVSVAVITSSGLSVTDDQYFCKWEVDGAMINPVSGGAVDRLGDLLVAVLLESNSPVNLSAFIAESDLNRYRVAGFFNDPEATPYEIATDLISLIPGAGLRRDANGIRPVLRRLDYADEECAGYIQAVQTDPITGLKIANPDFAPADGDGGWQYHNDDRDLTTSTRTSFALRVKTGRFRREVVCTATPSDGNPAEFATQYALMAEQRLSYTDARSPTRRRSVELDYVYDDTTASFIAADRVRQDALEYRTRRFKVSLAFGWLELNEEYLLDDDVYTGIQVEVVEKEPTIGGYFITLALDDIPERLADKG